MLYLQAQNLYADPKLCITIVLHFPWNDCINQDELETR